MHHNINSRTIYTTATVHERLRFISLNFVVHIDKVFYTLERHKSRCLPVPVQFEVHPGSFVSLNSVVRVTNF